MTSIKFVGKCLYLFEWTCPHLEGNRETYRKQHSFCFGELKPGFKTLNLISAQIVIMWLVIIHLENEKKMVTRLVSGSPFP